MTKTQGGNNIVLDITETPREKELRALSEIAQDRQHSAYAAIRSVERQNYVWDLLWQVKASVPRPTGGALFVSGSMRVGGALPEDLQVWKVPNGMPSY